jgi:NADPH-dependent curcumin reductase CurA
MKYKSVVATRLGPPEVLEVVENELRPPAKAATLILNYLVAYQVLHRSAKVKDGETALIIGASGGIGTALLQLGRLANLSMYGIASKSKHDILPELLFPVSRIQPPKQTSMS